MIKFACLILLELSVLLNLTSAQCKKAFISYREEFCTLDLDSHERSCEEMVDTDYENYGLTMNPLNGEIYMATNLEYDSYDERSIIKFNESDPNDYTVIVTYDGDEEYMAGITFGGCENDSPILYSISGAGADYDSATIWKINVTNGETRTVVTIDDWHDDGRSIAYSPYSDKLYLLNHDSAPDEWYLVELDPNLYDSSPTNVNDTNVISSSDLNIIATFSDDQVDYRYLRALAIMDEQHILFVGYDKIYKVNIDDADDITCIGDVGDNWGLKGLICADMSQDYLDFANCPDTTETKETRVSVDVAGCLSFTDTYDSSGSSKVPIGWILFLVATILVCVVACFKNDYIKIWCGRNKSSAIPDPAIELEQAMGNNENENQVK